MAINTIYGHTPNIFFRVNTLDNPSYLSNPKPDGDFNNLIEHLKNATVWIEGIDRPLKHGDSFTSGFLPQRPDSITINEYHKGQSISPHVDSKSSGEVISVLSILSEATMVFRKGVSKETVLLNPRSLVQMRGEIRNLWEHSIEPVKSTRYSIVFRCSK